MAKHLLTIICYLLISLLQLGCRRESNSPTNSLPPLTTSGKNTMGCLVDGQLFIPQEPWLSPYSYHFATLTTYPAVKLHMGWMQDLNSCDLSSIGISLDSISLAQGTTYTLGQPPDTANGSSTAAQWAAYNPSTGCSSISFPNYTTTAAVGGQVSIVYYNSASGIVSGTFWFDAIGPMGDTVHVREGRFDMTIQ